MYISSILDQYIDLFIELVAINGPDTTKQYNLQKSDVMHGLGRQRLTTAFSEKLKSTIVSKGFNIISENENCYILQINIGSFSGNLEQTNNLNTAINYYRGQNGY